MLWPTSRVRESWKLLGEVYAMKQTSSTQADRTKQQLGSADSPVSMAMKRDARRTNIAPGEVAWTRYADSRLKLYGHIR